MRKILWQQFFGKAFNSFVENLQEREFYEFIFSVQCLWYLDILPSAFRGSQGVKMALIEILMAAVN